MVGLRLVVLVWLGAGSIWEGPTEDVYARYYEAFEHFRL
jgi:hypothetical protein